MQIGESFQNAEHAAFHWEGGSNAALLIHGYPGTPAEMRPIAELLHDAGWTVNAPLLPGFGSEMETLADKTNEDWLHAIEAEYLSLRGNAKTMAIVGYSMGGALALQLAAKYPPDALILFAPLYQLDHWLWRTLPLLRIFFPKVRISRFFDLDFDDPNTREGIEKYMPGIDLDDPQVQEEIRNYEIPVAMFNQIRRTGQLAFQAAGNIAAPTIVFQGTHDDLITPSMTQRLVGKIGSHAKYVEVAGMHDLLDTDGAAWTTIWEGLTQFVDSLHVGEHIA